MKIILTNNHMLTKFPCSICGEYFELSPVTAALRFDDGTYGDVCPECLKAGKDGLKKRVGIRIDRLVQEKECAERLMELVDQIEDMPTFEAFEQANEEVSMEE